MTAPFFGVMELAEPLPGKRRRSDQAVPEASPTVPNLIAITEAVGRGRVLAASPNSTRKTLLRIIEGSLGKKTSQPNLTRFSAGRGPPGNCTS